MKRETLINKLAKSVAQEDNLAAETFLTWSEEDAGDKELYRHMADAALVKLAKIIRKTPIVEDGYHDITDRFVDFFAGDVTDFPALDER